MLGWRGAYVECGRWFFGALLCLSLGFKAEGNIEYYNPQSTLPVDPIGDTPETEYPTPTVPSVPDYQYPPPSQTHPTSPDFNTSSQPTPQPHSALVGGGRSLFGWFRDSLFYTLNPSTALQGPRLRDGNEHEYVSAVFRAILRQANARAQKYWSIRDTSAYFGFLIGSLTVPYHESHLVHFRHLSPLGGRCVPGLNSGESLQKAREPSLWVVFQRYLKLASPPVVPECDQLYTYQDAVQLVSSGDYFSNGIMQVAINWHVDDYLIPRTYLNVEATLAYGLGVYFAGYDQAYLNSYDYPCLRARNQRVSYYNLIRGAWSGNYNSGNMANTCRFAHPHDRWAANDAGFLQSLNLVLANRNSLYTQYLTGLDRLALNEIISNFRYGHHSRVYLDQILRR